MWVDLWKALVIWVFINVLLWWLISGDCISCLSEDALLWLVKFVSRVHGVVAVVIYAALINSLNLWSGGVDHQCAAFFGQFLIALINFILGVIVGKRSTLLGLIYVQFRSPNLFKISSCFWASSAVRLFSSIVALSMPLVVRLTFSNSFLKSSVSVGVCATCDVTLLERALNDRA